MALLFNSNGGWGGINLVGHHLKAGSGSRLPSLIYDAVVGAGGFELDGPP